MGQFQLPPQTAMDQQTQNDIIYGKNAVAEFLKGKGEADTVYLAFEDKQFDYYCALAKECGAVVKKIHPRKLDTLCKTDRHQGVAASVRLVSFLAPEQLLDIAQERGESPFILIADGISDPHNLGAIIRTAECCGVHGIVIPQRGGCGITPAVMATSAGALTNVAVARTVNLARTVQMYKDRGVFVYCADMDGEYCCKSNLTGPIALVIGSEGFGVSQLVKKLCDGVVALPMKGQINSLNASVAAGVLMYEILRQRG